MKFYITLTLSLLVVSIQAKTIRIVGADLLGAHIEPLVQAEAKKAGWDVEIAFNGSLDANTQILNETADLAIVAVPDGEQTNPDFASIPFAFEVASIIVNDANPLDEISYQQLKLLFGKGGRSVMENWGQLGGDGPWLNRQILVHIVRDSDRLSLELFRHKILGDVDFRDKVQEWSNRDALLKHLVEVNGGIAVISGNKAIPQTRLLFVSEGEGAQSYRPTEQSVLYGDYGLRLPYYLIYKAKPGMDEAAQRVARFLLSEEISQAMVKAGYVSLPQTERREFQMELELGQ